LRKFDDIVLRNCYEGGATALIFLKCGNDWKAVCVGDDDFVAFNNDKIHDFYQTKLEKKKVEHTITPKKENGNKDHEKFSNGLTLKLRKRGSVESFGFCPTYFHSLKLGQFFGHHQYKEMSIYFPFGVKTVQVEKENNVFLMASARFWFSVPHELAIRFVYNRLKSTRDCEKIAQELVWLYKCFCFSDCSLDNSTSVMVITLGEKEVKNDGLMSENLIKYLTNLRETPQFGKYGKKFKLATVVTLTESKRDKVYLLDELFEKLDDVKETFFPRSFN